LGRGLEPGCTVPVHLMFVIVTVGLCLFMVIAVCEYLRFSIVLQMHLTVLLDALYIMYNYHCTLLSRSQHSSLPTQVKSSPFPSTHVRRSPFSPFKPKSKAFTKSLRHDRPWRPTNIPTIRIDVASDQPSASSYSNGSSSTGSAGVIVFKFATKYPSLRTMPLDSIGQNSKAALERESKKDEGKEREREREEADLRLVETVEVPNLPKYSVFGSDSRC